MVSRVVHITLVHQPNDVRVFAKECVGLAAHGYDVHLIVPRAVQDHDRGVHFHDVPLAAEAPRPLRILRRWWSAFRQARRLRAALYHLHDPELIPIGLLLKLCGAKIVYDAHEDAPVEALSLNRHRPLYGRALSCAWAALLGAARHVFDGFVAATPKIAESLPVARTAIVRNFPRLERFADLLAANPPYNARGPVVVYVGTLSLIRGLKEMLGAMALLPPELPAELVIAGRFASPESEAAARAHPVWPRVRYAGGLPWEEVIAELGRARIGLVTLHPTPEYLDSLPVKLFEYMAAALPVVASDFLLWRAIVEEAQCGVLVDPLDEAAIAAAIASLLREPDVAERMGAAGRAAVWRAYSWENEERALHRLYSRLLGHLPDVRDLS